MYQVYKQITIRNAQISDCTQLAAWWNDGSVMAHAGFPLGLGITAEKIMADIATDSDDTRRRLVLLFDGNPIGEMCYSHVDSNTAEIGIKICESNYQERGIGRVALSMLIRNLWETGYSRIILDTNPKNTRTRHVYEKLVSNWFESIKILGAINWESQNPLRIMN